MATGDEIASRSTGVTVVTGTAIHAERDGSVEYLRDAAVCFDSNDHGKVKILLMCQPGELKDAVRKKGLTVTKQIQLTPSQFLIPGFVDAHIHASQYSYTGTGYDLGLLEWLKKYTFLTESRYGDAAFTQDIYSKAVRRCLVNGTTTACYHSTIHLEGSKMLADIVATYGQRALIGKVSMDVNSPDTYRETTSQSIRDTQDFIEHVLARKSPLVEPVVTPRFVISCTDSLLDGLGQLASEYGLRVQSHLNETMEEIEMTSKLFPGHDTTAKIFDYHGLLNDRSIMAHCIHMKESELELFKKRNSGMVHCPSSNCNLRSGIMDVRAMFKAGMKVGLGTDVAGGHSPSMLDAIRHAVQASNTLYITKGDKEYQFLSHNEAFYMATMGGARVLGLDHKIGSFEEGKEFDALVVDVAAAGSPFDVFDSDTLKEQFSKFLYLGDDRNIVKVFVAGREVKDALES